MDEINGLPIAFFVVAGGIIVLLVSWLLMRFGKAIARAFLIGAVVLIGGVLAGTAMRQAGANLQQSKATVKVAEVAQTASVSNLLLVGAVGCIGGVALMAVMGALAFAGAMWCRAQQAERRQAEWPAELPRRRQAKPLPDYERVVYVDSGDAGFEDLVAIGDLDGMAWDEWV